MNQYAPFRYRRLLGRIGLALGVMLVVVSAIPIRTVAAAPEYVEPLAAEELPHDLSNPQELETFMDGLMTGQLDSYHIPGAVVAVVRDGEMIFAKGYGYADLATLKPVEQDRTLFHPGSVSKLFTWTAVMQLVEQGKLDLDADVNTYLDFTIPATYPQPVTLRNLMTHTPGFEDKGLGIFAASADELIPLGDFLAANIPARVYPPGEMTAYSNYGAALAGYIVERVSGIPFEQYIEENIFNPLGMQHSTFRQRDFPADLEGDMSVGYTYVNGAPKAGGPEYLQIAPAGALSSTAIDMAKFMIAHLQNGQYGEARILQEATAQEMHRQQFTNDPRVNGIGLGFVEMNANNLRIIGHGGDTMYFHTLLALIPEQNVGLYVSYNSLGTGGMGAVQARQDLLQAFLDRYYPVEKSPAPEPPADFASRAGQFTGAYMPSRSNYSTPEKAATLFQPLTVSATSEGMLLVSYGPIQMQLVEVGPLEFQNIDDQARVVFQEEEDGKIAFAFIDWAPVQRFIKLPWYASPSVHLPVLIGCLMLFAVGLIGWPIRLLEERRRAKSAGESRPLLPRLARWVGVALALLNVVFAIAITALFITVSANPIGIPPAMPVVMTIPVVTALLALGMAAFAVLAWKDQYWKFGGRLFYTLVTLAGLVFIWLVNWWRLWVIGL